MQSSKSCLLVHDVFLHSVCIQPCHILQRYLRENVLVVLGDPRFERWCLLPSRTLLSLVGVVFGASFGVCIFNFCSW